jgi:hypothetical protein
MKSSQFHISLLENLCKEIMTTHIARCRYVPTIPRFFRLHINSLQNSHLNAYSSHTHHHYVPIIQHFSAPNPITIIKLFLKPLIFSSFSSTCPYIMQHDLPTPKRRLWCSRRTRPSTLKISWN